MSQPAQNLATVEERGTAVTTPADMLNRALESGASMEVMEKLMGLHERWEANQARKSFDSALAAARAEIPVILKNRTVDFTSQKGRTHYQHEDLAGIARTVDPILAKHGLSYRFRTHTGINEPVQVTCIVSHRDGHSEENTPVAARDDTGNKNSIQMVGSTITYLQRYTLKAALGLSASTDDDAGGADKTPVETVSVEQIEALRDLIDKAGTDADTFCKVAKIEAVTDLPSAQYDRAVQWLNQRIAARTATVPKAQFDAMERGNA